LLIGVQRAERRMLLVRLVETGLLISSCASIKDDTAPILPLQKDLMVLDGGVDGRSDALFVRVLLDCERLNIVFVLMFIYI